MFIVPSSLARQGFEDYLSRKLSLFFLLPHRNEKSPPLKKAIDLLITLAADRGESARGTPINSPQLDEAIFSLLDDLDEGSRGGGTVSTSGVRQIDTRQMAAMSITFEIVV